MAENKKKTSVKKNTSAKTKSLNSKVKVNPSKKITNSTKKETNTKTPISKKNKTTTKTNKTKNNTKVVTKNKTKLNNSQKQNKKVKTTKEVVKKVEKKSFKIRVNNLVSLITKNVSKIFNRKKTNNKPNQKHKYKPVNQKKRPFLTKNSKTAFIVLAIICGVILLLEGVYVIVHKISIENKKVYYDTMNSITIDETDIIAVGSSNFKYSKNYSHTNGLEKGKIIKYNKNGEILFEKMYQTGINTTFSSVINISDGYIVVGSGVFSEKESTEEAREAFIIKYDKDGNLVWEKFYQVITNTRFNKVIETSDGYIAIGQSIYANMEMGNHRTGGGIIVKYDKDGNQIWHNNHGGMKSGNFNDVVEVDGNFYVAGKDATDSANIVKFDKDGKYIWHKNYSYTDTIGFTGIAYLNNSLYVVGSKKILPDDYQEGDKRNTINTDALLVIYDLEGNKKEEKTFGGSNYERYNSILAYHNNLYVVGNTSSKDAGFKLETDGELMTGLVVRYDENGNILKKDILGGSNNDNLTDITTDGVCLYISGYSNSKDGNITTAKNNGKDYFGKVIKLDFKFRTILVK